jgi:hypothetical protein
MDSIIDIVGSWLSINCWLRSFVQEPGAHRVLNCPRGVLAGALVASTRPSSWADVAASSHPVPAHPGGRGASREQSREHRGFRSRLVADASGAPSSATKDRSAGRARQGRCKPRAKRPATGRSGRRSQRWGVALNRLDAVDRARFALVTLGQWRSPGRWSRPSYSGTCRCLTCLTGEYYDVRVNCTPSGRGGQDAAATFRNIWAHRRLGRRYRQGTSGERG